MLVSNGGVEKNGIIFWFCDHKLHKENGPAVEFPDGDWFYMQHGDFHRTNGPAVKFNGNFQYFINGKELTELKFIQEAKKCIL